MAASDDVAAVAMEPWMTSFAETWMSEAFSRDSKALAMALQKSLASSSGDHSEFLPVFDTPAGSGSEPESTAAVTATRKRKGDVAVAAAVGGKVAKRKSRASKRTQTTFITADPENFRQMVQQVTGVRFAGGSTVVKPEPMRAGVNGGGGRLPLPTLDTSAFLYDRQYNQHEVVGPLCYGGDVAGGGGGGGFDSYTTSTTTSFPTLESWKVM